LTAQGSPRARFRRAIEGGWVFQVELAAREVRAGCSALVRSLPHRERERFAASGAARAIGIGRASNRRTSCRWGEAACRVGATGPRAV